MFASLAFVIAAGLPAMLPGDVEHSAVPAGRVASQSGRSDVLLTLSQRNARHRQRAPRRVQATHARPVLVSQAAAIAARSSTTPAGGATFAPPGGDSLKNGAIIGGVVAGVGMGSFIYWLCNALDDTGGDQPCAGPALVWAGIAGAGGALVGAGVDALFDGTPQARMKPRPGMPPRSVRPGVAVRWRF